MPYRFILKLDGLLSFLQLYINIYCVTEGVLLCVLNIYGYKIILV